MMTKNRSTHSQRERISDAQTTQEVEALLAEGLEFEHATDRTKTRLRQAAARRMQELGGVR